MKIQILAAVAALTLAAPAAATDVAAGMFAGGASSSAFTMSGSATGGIGWNGNSGFTSVENRSGAFQMAGAGADLQFVEIDGVRGNRVERDYDGIEVDLGTFAVVQGEDYSMTRVRDRGNGTIGAGGGFAVRTGSAWSHGGFGGFGTASW